MMMNVGKLKRRIDVYGMVKTVNELEETDFKPQKIKSIWCEIIPQTGNMQRAQADNILSTCTHKVVTRYNAAKDILPSQWFVYRGKRFDIRYVLNPNFNNEKLEFFVEDVTR